MASSAALPVGITMVDLRTPLVLATAGSQRAGLLRKRGQYGVAAKWKKRWFVLNNSKFWYFAGNAKPMDKPKGCIDLTGSSIEVRSIQLAHSDIAEKLQSHQKCHTRDSIIAGASKKVQRH